MKIIFFRNVRCKTFYLSISFLLTLLSISPITIVGQETKARQPSKDKSPCQNLSNIKPQGFQIGVKTDEVLRTLNRPRKEIVELEQEETNAKGKPIVVEAGNTTFTFYNYENKIKGVTRIDFKFYQDKAYWIRVFYNGTIKWNDINEYLEAISKSFNLPVDSWEISKSGDSDKISYQGLIKDCENIRLFAYLRKIEPSEFGTNLTADGYEKDSFTGEPIYYEQGLVLTDLSVIDTMEEKATNLIENERVRRKKLEEQRINNKKKVFKP